MVKMVNCICILSQFFFFKGRIKPKGKEKKKVTCSFTLQR